MGCPWQKTHFLKLHLRIIFTVFLVGLGLALKLCFFWQAALFAGLGRLRMKFCENLMDSTEVQKFLGKIWGRSKLGGFGEHGFKHRTQWVFRGSLSSGDRTQWVPLSLLFVCQSELTEFLPNSPSLAENSVSSLLRNSTLETVFRPSFHINITLR